MRETVYIIGHKNPDSDSICSAIAYADYKKSQGDVEAIPIRLGEINRETKFILDYFDVEVPVLMETVRLAIDDLNFDKIGPVSPDISMKMALNLMNVNNLNSLAIVDEKERLLGIVTLSDIMRSYIDIWDNSILGKSKTSLDNILDTLSAEPIFLPKKIRELSGKILVLAMDELSLQDYLDENDIVICGNRKGIQRLAIDKGVSLMIITGQAEDDPELIELAKENNVALIFTPYDSFTASRLISQSVPISQVMTKDNLLAFNLEDLLDDVKLQMSQTRYRAYPVLDSQDKVLGMMSRYHLIYSMRKKVILVDHNERSQSIDGLEEAEILEIIDHHRVADVFTGSPIYFRNEPVGSTCTIIASIMFENGRRPSKKIAGILAAGIISDTLLFRSPTSTNTDRLILDRLARIADLDMEEFAMEMFKAGTSLTGKNPKELLNQDFKSFLIGEEKVGIAQVYTMDSESLENMKEDLIVAMEKRVEDEDYSIFVLMLTDIFKEASEMVAVGPNKDFVGRAFDKELINSSFYAPGVLSRKKQVVPPITDILGQTQEILT